LSNGLIFVQSLGSVSLSFRINLLLMLPDEPIIIQQKLKRKKKKNHNFILFCYCDIVINYPLNQLLFKKKKNQRLFDIKI